MTRIFPSAARVPTSHAANLKDFSSSTSENTYARCSLSIMGDWKFAKWLAHCDYRGTLRRRRGIPLFKINSCDTELSKSTAFFNWSENDSKKVSLNLETTCLRKFTVSVIPVEAFFQSLVWFGPLLNVPSHRAVWLLNRTACSQPLVLHNPKVFVIITGKLWLCPHDSSFGATDYCFRGCLSRWYSYALQILLQAQIFCWSVKSGNAHSWQSLWYVWSRHVSRIVDK